MTFSKKGLKRIFLSAFSPYRPQSFWPERLEPSHASAQIIEDEKLI
jgi:hypothetical protein